MITLSIDDGCASDTRAAELADKYEIPCTFYWPVELHSLAHSKGYRPLDYEKALRIARKHEIGSHTITHRHLTDLEILDATQEIIGSKFMLERMFNKEIRKFCPPRGYTNEVLTKLTLNFYQSQRLTKGKGLVHIHPNSGANGNIHWIDYFLSLDEDNVELWGHSWEWDKYDMWQEIERFFRENIYS